MSIDVRRDVLLLQKRRYASGPHSRQGRSESVSGSDVDSDPDSDLELDTDWEPNSDLYPACQL